MPFTPPTTATSVGTTGYLAVFSVQNNASPPAFVPVAELKSFKLAPISVPNVDFSTLVSPNNTRELRPGMIMPGTVELTGNWIGDASQLAFITDSEAQSVVAIQATFSCQNGTKTGTFTSTAFVKDLNLGPFENDKPNEYQVNFQLAGAFTITTA